MTPRGNASAIRRWWTVLAVVMGISFLILIGMGDGLALAAFVMSLVAAYKAGEVK